MTEDRMSLDIKLNLPELNATDEVIGVLVSVTELPPLTVEQACQVLPALVSNFIELVKEIQGPVSDG